MLLSLSLAATVRVMFAGELNLALLTGLQMLTVGAWFAATVIDTHLAEQRGSRATMQQPPADPRPLKQGRVQ